MRISLCLGVVFLAAGVLSAGCGPAVSKSDLGTIVTELPKLKGSEQPFEMKQLGPPKEHQPDDDVLRTLSCEILPAMRASARKRSLASASSQPASVRILRATVRPITVSRAR